VVEQTKKQEVALSLVREELSIAGNNILTTTKDEEEIGMKKRLKKVSNRRHLSK
jgi:hypothetical protein